MSDVVLDFVIVTGLSGAGKTQTLRHLEDFGYFCIDNLPPALISKFAELCRQSAGRVSKIAVVMDIRGGEFFDSMSEALLYLKCKGYRYQILFLEAEDETLIRRYKEVRRQHPLAGAGSILEGIAAERRKLSCLREQADLILNTTHLTTQQLRQELYAYLMNDDTPESLIIRVLSFGFKHGLPLDADLVFDVRFLPNPFYVAELRNLPGTASPVRNYVLQWPIADEFLHRLESFLEWLIPLYIQEGKTHLVIAIGCTGGRHRSVVIAEQLRHRLKTQHRVYLEHRDVQIGR